MTSPQEDVAQTSLVACYVEIHGSKTPVPEKVLLRLLSEMEKANTYAAMFGAAAKGALVVEVTGRSPDKWTWRAPTDAERGRLMEVATRCHRR